MKRSALPIEKKTAASATVGTLAAFVFGLAATYHWFTPPPEYLTVLGVTLVSGVVGWLTPHTSRSLPAVQPPATTAGSTPK